MTTSQDNQVQSSVPKRRGRPPSATLAEAFPELAAQLVDQSLARTLSKGSGKKVEWQCDKGHQWEAAVFNRTNAKNTTGCPVCSGRKVIAGQNDLATTHPDIAKLCLNPEDATKYPAFSNKKLWFQCDNDTNHKWQAPISRLTNQGSRCPYCAGRKALAGQSDLATTHPNIAAQLVDQNAAISIRAGSSRKVQWRCPNNADHLWDAPPYDRTSKNTGCPHCPQHTATSKPHVTTSVRQPAAQPPIPSPALPQIKKSAQKGFEGRIWLTDAEWETYRRRMPVRYLTNIRKVVEKRHKNLCVCCHEPGTNDNPLQLAHRIGFRVGVLQWGLTPDWLDHPDNITLAHRGACNNTMELDNQQVYEHLLYLRLDPLDSPAVLRGATHIDPTTHHVTTDIAITD